MAELLVLAAAVIAIGQAVKLMLQANKIYAASQKEIEVIAAKPRELAAMRDKMQGQITDQKSEIGRLLTSTNRLRQEKGHLEEELAKLRGRKKDDLYAMERTQAPGQPLWEILVYNDAAQRHIIHEGYALSWAQGRHYLVAAGSERDARRRAELKFLGTQGFRIMTVERCTRL